MKNSLTFTIYKPLFSWVNKSIFNLFVNINIFCYITSLTILVIMPPDKNNLTRDISVLYLCLYTLLVYFIQPIFRTNIYHLFFAQKGQITFQSDTFLISINGQIINYTTNRIDKPLNIVYYNYYHLIGRYLNQHLGIHNYIKFYTDNELHHYHFLIKNEQDAKAFLSIMENWKQNKVNFVFENLCK
jgi:hypothetical protein